MSTVAVSAPHKRKKKTKDTSQFDYMLVSISRTYYSISHIDFTLVLTLNRINCDVKAKRGKMK